MILSCTCQHCIINHRTASSIYFTFARLIPCFRGIKDSTFLQRRQSLVTVTEKKQSGVNSEKRERLVLCYAVVIFRLKSL